MGRISEETIQKVLAAAVIEDVVSSYVGPMKRAGGNYKALCPFHVEKSPSFTVTPSKSMWYCFGCHKGGNAIGFVKEMDSSTFAESVRKLAAQYNIPVVEEAGGGDSELQQSIRTRLLAVHRTAADWFHQLLLRHAEADAARQYLKKRGLNSDVAKRWTLGYAPEDVRFWRDWIREHRYSDRLLVESGLFAFRDTENPSLGTYARFRHRIMFPVCNDQGEVIAFSGRVLDAAQKGGKYVNSPETAIFNKSKVFFGFDKSKRAIHKTECAILCEGQIDLITAFEHGIENIIAPLGTAFTEEHARVIRRNTDQVILCFDADKAGYSAAQRCYTHLAPEGVFVRIASLPPGEDPDSLIRTQGADAFRERLANSREFFDFQIDQRLPTLNPSNIREVTKLASDVAENLSMLRDKISQEAAIGRAATRMQVSAEDLRKHVQRATRARQKHATGAAERTARIASKEAPVTGIAIDNKSVRLLLRASLTDLESRCWLYEQEDDKPWLAFEGGDLLEKSLHSNIDLTQPQAAVAFLSTLSEEEQVALTRVLSEEMEITNLPGARGAFTQLKLLACRQRMDQINQELRRPGTTTEDVLALTLELTRLKKESVDLMAQAHHSL